MSREFVRKPRLRGLLGAVALVALLAACTTPAPTAMPTSPPAPKPTATSVPPTPTPVPEPVTVTMWTWMNPEGQTPREIALKQILDGFAAANPLIKVEITSVNWQEIDAKWRAAVETGDAPDLIWLLKSVPDRWKFLVNLDETVLSDLSAAEWADLSTMNTAESRIGTDHNLAFPIWPSAGEILYYRTDLFAEAGIETPLRTWDDFLEAGQKLSKDTNGDGSIDVWGYGDCFGERAAAATSFFYALADLQDSFYDLETKTPLFDNQNAVQSAQLVVDLVNLGIMPEDAIANDYETMLEQFQRGRFAMVHGGSHRYGSIKAAVGFGAENVGIMPWPSWKGDRVGPAFGSGGWHIGIWKDTRHLSEAGLLLRALMSPESSRLWMEVGGQVPNRVSLVNDPYLQQPGKEFLALPAKIRNEHFYLPEPVGINTAETAPAIHEALQQMMLDGKVDPALLQAANERIKRAQAY